MSAAAADPGDAYDPAAWPLTPGQPAPERVQRLRERWACIEVMEHLAEAWRRYRLTIIAAHLAASAVREFFRDDQIIIGKEIP